MDNNRKFGSDFTTGGITGGLVKFALPLLLALFLQSMYGAVDLMIVGRFSDAAAISAVATGSQVMLTITSVLAGVSMGVTVLLGRRVGEGNMAAAGGVVGGGMALLGIAGVAVALVMQLLADPASRLLRAPTEAFAGTTAYVRICCAGAVFIVAYNLLGAIFRGLGDSKMPLVTVAIACVFNICGDLLLVAVFGLGAVGAAIATVAAQALSVALSAAIIARRGLPFKLTRRDFRLGADSAGVLRLGWPIALQDLLVSASFLVLTAIVNGLGLIASAGVGVAEKVCAFIMLVPSAFSQALSAFVAQNAGAGRFDRAAAALRRGIAMSLAVGLVLGLVSFLRGDLLAGIFADDPLVIESARQYLRAYAIDCLLVSFLFCFIGYFNGIGRTGFVMAQGIVGAFLVRVPTSFLLSRVMPVSLFRIGLATPCSTVVQIVLCAIYFARCRNELKSAQSAKDSLL